jgi:hypothetical protein
MIKVMLIDELLKAEVVKAGDYLSAKAKKSPMDNLYWIELPESILSLDQKKWVGGHGALKIAIELGKSWVRFELLLRSESLTNEGGGELSAKQLDFIYTYIDNFINYIVRQ